MYCQNCGTSLVENARFCKSCGSEQKQNVEAQQLNVSSGTVGFSWKINDPAFAKYIKSSNRWSGIFAFILAVAAVIGFFIYGETSSEMENPQALYIGFGIGGMFLLIALLQIIGRGKSKTWDGIVVDKRVKKKRRKQRTGDDDFYWVDYMEYVVFIKSDNGKKHQIRVEDDDTVYNYYQVGDKVRHHKGLNTYEKYDKSRDKFIICNACASINDIQHDVCSRCKCPLLK